MLSRSLYAVLFALAVATPVRSEVCEQSNCVEAVRMALERAAVDAKTTATVLRDMGLLERAELHGPTRRLTDTNWVNMKSATTMTYISIFMVVLCVCCAALAAGLTMGLVSLNPLDVKIKALGGDAREQADARIVLRIIEETKDERRPAMQPPQERSDASGEYQPLLDPENPPPQREARWKCCGASRHHHILVTFLLFNALANEALPLFLDELVPSIVAVILSVTLVLVFGEIIPSAIFTGPDQLHLAAKLSPVVIFLMGIFSPVAYPIAYLLDVVLGHQPLRKYTRDEISALVEVQQGLRVHRQSFRGAGPLLGDSSSKASVDDLQPPKTVDRQNSGMTLSDARSADVGMTEDETKVVTGVIKTAKRPTSEAMTKMKDVYSLSLNTVMNSETMSRIVASGYSRIPVHKEGNKNDLRGFLLVKRLITLSSLYEAGVTKDNLPKVKDLELRLPVCVSPSSSLLDVLNLFQVGRSHMAFVSKDPEETRRRLTAQLEGDGKELDGDAEPLGILTIEDIVEAILEEEIYDEADFMNREVSKLLSEGIKKWQALIAAGETENLRLRKFENVTYNTTEEPMDPEEKPRSRIRFNLKKLSEAIGALDKVELDCLLQAFEVFDRDHDGKISEKELGEVLKSFGQEYTEKQLNEMINALDDDEDGSVDFAEFANMIALSQEDAEEVKVSAASEPEPETKTVSPEEVTPKDKT